MDTENSPQGKIENLEYRINVLLDESRERLFTEYLTQLQKRVAEKTSEIEKLQAELDRNYDIYVKRNFDTAAFADTCENADSVNHETSDKNVQCTQGNSNNAEFTPWHESLDNANAQVRAETNTEFIVGASILGVVGGVFILTALVMFGMNYMNGMIKGLCLYAICAAVLAFSELFLHKHVKKLGSIFSSIALCGIYLSTVINYISLKNFGMWPTFIITAIVSVLVILLGKKRESVAYKVIGIIATYVCFMMLDKNISNVEFIVISVILLCINAVYAFVQIENTHTYSLHMLLNTFFAMCFIISAVNIGVDTPAVITYLVTAAVITHLILVLRLTQTGNKAGILISYAVSALFYAIAVNVLIYECKPYSFVYLPQNITDLQIMKAAVAVAFSAVGLVGFIFLHIKKIPEKWYVYLYVNFMLFTIYILRFFDMTTLENGEGLDNVICIFVLLMLSKLLLLKRDNLLIKICDGVLTFMLCMGLMSSNGIVSYILIVMALISVACISRWNTYNEIILTGAITYYAAARMPSVLKLPVIVGILFMAMLLFNHVSRYRGKNIILFNIFAFIVQAICFVMLVNPIYRNAYITYLSMLVFGVATIVIMLQPAYNMDFKFKNIVLAVFLTYMGLIFKSGVPILNSIILMIVALICVGVGFVIREKPLRIYGLILALCICVKIVLYDFMDAANLQKIILFFAVGVIALIIAGIYIILEKKAVR